MIGPITLKRRRNAFSITENVIQPVRGPRIKLVRFAINTQTVLSFYTKPEESMSAILLRILGAPSNDPVNDLFSEMFAATPQHERRMQRDRFDKFMNQKGRPWTPNAPHPHTQSR